MIAVFVTFDRLIVLLDEHGGDQEKSLTSILLGSQMSVENLG